MALTARRPPDKAEGRAAELAPSMPVWIWTGRSFAMTRRPPSGFRRMSVAVRSDRTRPSAVFASGRLGLRGLLWINDEGFRLA